MSETFSERAAFPAGSRDAVVLTLTYWQESGQWLAECQELGTAAFGQTMEEAQEDLRDAVSLQLDGALKLGFLPEFLREHGVG